MEVEGGGGRRGGRGEGRGTSVILWWGSRGENGVKEKDK